MSECNCKESVRRSRLDTMVAQIAPTYVARNWTYQNIVEAADNFLNEIDKRIDGEKTKTEKKPKFKVGDRVRIERDFCCAGLKGYVSYIDKDNFTNEFYYEISDLPEPIHHTTITEKDLTLVGRANTAQVQGKSAQHKFKVGDKVIYNGPVGAEKGTINRVDSDGRYAIKLDTDLQVSRAPHTALALVKTKPKTKFKVKTKSAKKSSKKKSVNKK